MPGLDRCDGSEIAGGGSDGREEIGQLGAVRLNDPSELSADDRAVAWARTALPSGVIEASTALPSSGCGVRLISSAASSRFTSGVTEVA